MSRSMRVTVLIGAVVVALVAFIALRPDDDEPTDNAQAPSAEAVTTGTETEAPAVTQTTTEPPARPKPDVTRIRVESPAPVGGEAKVEVTKGEPIRLVVTSDVADEVHVHGYDLSKPVGPGQPARIAFKANLEGIFEVELEERAVPIAQLVVNP